MGDVLHNEDPLRPVVVRQAVVAVPALEGSWNQLPDMATDKKPNDKNWNSRETSFLVPVVTRVKDDTRATCDTSADSAASGSPSAWRLKWRSENFKIKIRPWLSFSLKNYDWYVSFEDLHAMAKRATPEKLMLYKLSLQLFKIFNYSIPVTEWYLLNQNIIFTSRQTKFKTTKRNRLRLGMNTMSNRLWILNDKILQRPWLHSHI